MPLRIVIRIAKHSEHKTVCNIAKDSQYTKDFSNMIFSGEDCYKQGRIKVAESVGSILGFSCFRHRTRIRPCNVLYFLGVSKAYQRSGVGSRLLRDLYTFSPLGVELKVMKDNEAVVEWYLREGFVEVDEAYDGKGVVLRRE